MTLFVDPTMISLMRRLLVGPIVLALAFVSLGTLAQAATKAADAAIVRAGLLTINDFPPGWTAFPDDSSSSADVNFSAYGKRCAALQKQGDALKKGRTAHGDSPDFKQGDYDQVSNSVVTFPAVAGAKATLHLFTKPDLSSCLERAFSHQFSQQAKKQGATVKATVGRLSVPQAGDESAGYEFAVTVSAKGVTLRLYIDLQLVLVGRAGLTFSFIGAGTSPLLAYQSLVNASVDRVRAAEAVTS